MEKLKPCPFCGGEASLSISDAEGNIRDEEYERNPWSGISYKLVHTYEQNKECPIASYSDDEGGSLGVYLYDYREDAIDAWNNRKV